MSLAPAASLARRLPRRTALVLGLVLTAGGSAVALPTTASAAACPALQTSTIVDRGDTGVAVRAVQCSLRANGAAAGLVVDGRFGAGTERAVMTFQARRGLTADGVVGRATYRALAGSVAAPPAAADKASVATGPTLRRGSTGPHVRTAQAALGVQVDGSYGARTEAAVRAFQSRTGLTPDGVLGPVTRKALAASGVGG